MSLVRAEVFILSLELVEKQQKRSQQRIARVDAAACFPSSAATISPSVWERWWQTLSNCLKKPHYRRTQFRENFSTQTPCKKPKQNKGHC